MKIGKLKANNMFKIYGSHVLITKKYDLMLFLAMGQDNEKI